LVVRVIRGRKNRAAFVIHATDGRRQRPAQDLARAGIGRYVVANGRLLGESRIGQS
jgi:hypothetical protein